MKVSVLILLTILAFAEATHKCVWVRGILRCNKDPSKNFNIEIRVYDKDGVSLFQLLDPDDLMGVSFTEEDGSFQLDGCGDDFNWFPGVDNPPEPFVQIHHYCNSEKGEIIKLPIFDTFVPETHDIGILELDKEEPKTIDVNKKVENVHIADGKEVETVHIADGDQLTVSLHGNEFVDQVRNPKFKSDVVKTLDQDEETNDTKSRITVTHPDEGLNSLENA